LVLGFPGEEFRFDSQQTAYSITLCTRHPLDDWKENIMDEQKALEWLTELLSVRGRVLTVQDTRDTVEEWDSLGDLLLVSGLDEQLGIVLNADEIAAINSIKGIIEIMEKNNAFLAR
jgi:acyl carrier protein